ncbi:MAG: TonB-dependent receptor [Acidobacteria bacterium]|nr:TonB-dependent receptor [Acidobacteriota bacterium]
MSAFGQIATTTSLVGAVTDAAGKLIPNATITAVNTGTQDTYHTTTTDQGYYTIQFVRIGNYELTLRQLGFQTCRVTGIQVNINQLVRTDVVLKVGDLLQTVNVVATTPPIKTDDASVSEIINMRDVADLPLNGRDPLKLAASVPGVLAGLKVSNTVLGQGFIGAGAREIQNSIALDGISIVNNLITTTPTRPTVDAVQEVEVQSATYSAQYGAYMGVHLNVITKSGTNLPHGSLAEFLRNDKLDARPFFLSPAAPKSPLRQNQFGFELDGPVVIPKIYNGRNQTFFMGSYEGFRQIRQSAFVSTLLTPLMWQGNFSQTTTVVKDPANSNQPFPGNIIPTTRLSLVVQKLRQYYPAPTLPGITSNFPTSLPNNNTTDQTVDRVDQNVGDKVRLFFRYQRQTTDLFTGAPNPVNATTGTVLGSNFSIGYTHKLTPSLVNDFRFGRQYFETGTLNYFYVNGLKDAGAKLGIPGFDGDVKFDNPGIPDFNITSFAGFGNSGTNGFQDDKTWQAAEQIGWNRGTHNIMAGAEFRKLVTGREASTIPRGAFNFNGQFTGYAPADFLLGVQLNDTTPGSKVRALVAEWRDGFFVLDKWQVSRKVTVNIGLRYELPTVPYTINGNATTLNPEQTALIPSDPPAPGFRFINPNHKDWAPRVGLAFRITDKTVLRAGYGIHYNPNQTNSFTFLSNNPPFSPVITYVSLPATPTLSLTNPTPTGSANVPPPPNVIADNWHLPTAYMNQWSFGLGRELSRGAGLEVQYVGSHSLHLDRNYYNNTPLPGPGAINPRRPNPRFTVIRTIQNDEIANYEALSISLAQRMRHGFQLRGSFTWAHTLDVTPDSNSGASPLNPYNWRADYSNSYWDIRRRFLLASVYELPFFSKSPGLLRTMLGKWQINGSVVAQTGVPFNVNTATDTANTSSGGQYRPNLVGRPHSTCGSGHLVGCIDAAAYALPPAGVYMYGNEGRNLLHGPGLFNIDFSVVKNFPLAERAKVQFRAEFFNFTNTPSFSNPASTFGTGTFGNIVSTTTENRDIQFGLKVVF